MSFVASIQADINDFQRNLDRAQARLDVFAATVGERIAKVGRSFQLIGGAMTVGVTAPLVAAGKAAFEMAAEFEDALGATDQIFKDASDATKKWADNLPTYFGIAKKEALEYSNMMGSMLVNIGNMTEQEASKQSAKLIELAGDLTAMYGGTTQDAVRALTGALKGNTTMLDNYGMAANDALVKAKAYSMGLAEQGKELDLSAKQAATLALIYEQSGAAQGQAAREADGASGSLRALKTEVTNLATELGNNLIPIITPIVNWIKEAAASFRDLSPEVQRTVVVVGAVAAAIGPLLLGLGTLMQIAPLVGAAFTVMTGPIGITVAAIAGAAVLIIKYWDEIKAYFTTGNGAEIWENISSGAKKIWNNLVDIFTKVKDFLIKVWDKIGSNVMAIVGNAFDTIFAIIGSIVGQISGVINVFSSLIRGDFTGAFEAAKGVVKGIFNAIKTIVLNVIGNVTQALSGFLKLIGADGLGASLENWANGLKPVKTEMEQVAEKTDEVTKKIQAKTVTTDLNTESTKKNTKAQKDFRSELDSALASWGIYEANVRVLDNTFNKLNETAVKAKATQEEFQAIASRNWIEKAALNLQKLGDVLFKAIKLPKLTGSLTIPLEINPVLNNGQYEKVVSNLKEDMINIGNLLSNSITDMMSNLGAALANGDSVLGAIGKSLLSSLGSFMKSIGQQMIALGTAGLAIKSFIANPFLSIAAGAALVALGSFASTSLSKQAKNIGSNGGGYSSSTQVVQNAFPRGSYYNNDKQEIELKLTRGELRGTIKLDNKRNTRLS